MSGEPPDWVLRCVRSVREVERAGWDRLAGDNPLLGHDWLSLMEREWLEPLERRYFLAEANGRLLGAAACYVESKSGGTESVDDLVFGRIGGLLSMRPALVCGFPWSTGSGCIADPALEPRQREALIKRLVSGVTAEAEGAGRTAVFLSVGGGERTVHAGLAAQGYHGVRHEPIYALDVHWPDFESYWRSLPSKNIRKNIRRELNKCRKQGVVITALEDPSAWAEELHRVVDRHFRRYGWRSFPYGPGWFADLKQRLGEDVAITGAWQQERLVGVAVSLRREGTRQMILACVDHQAEGGNLTHFNLAYYRGLEDCLATGDRRYVVGPGQHVSRLRRGFRPAESYIYCRVPGRMRRALLRGWLSLLGRWLRRKRGIASA